MMPHWLFLRRATAFCGECGEFEGFFRIFSTRESFFLGFIESSCKLTTTHHKNAFLRRVVSLFSDVSSDVNGGFQHDK